MLDYVREQVEEEEHVKDAQTEEYLRNGPFHSVIEAKQGHDNNVQKYQVIRT